MAKILRERWNSLSIPGIFFMFTCIVGLAFGIRSLLQFSTFAAHLRGIVIGILGPVALVVFSVFAIFQPRHRQASLMLLTLSVSFPLYIVEIWLAWPRAANPNWKVAQTFLERSGIEFDNRSKLEVMADFRAKGVDILPIASVSAAPVTLPNGNTVVPLPLFSARRVLSCNESGIWLVYETDEVGFKNPKGLWSRQALDAVAVGDSFVEGVCVPIGKDIVGVLRESYPASLNLGISGTDPLTYQQILLEFGARFKPRFVAFGWFEGNDVSGLNRNLSDPHLSPYLERAVPAGMYEHREMLAIENRRRMDSIVSQPLIEKISQVARLYNLRLLLGLGAAASGHAEVVDIVRARLSGRKDPNNASPLDAIAFEKLIRAGRDLVQSWGGKYVFVYLPSWRRYCGRVAEWQPWCDEEADFERSKVLEVVKRVGVPILDIHELFSASKHPERMFVYPGSHNSTEGYRVIGEALADLFRKLQAEGGGNGPH